MISGHALTARMEYTASVFFWKSSLCDKIVHKTVINVNSSEQGKYLFIKSCIFRSVLSD